MKNEKETAKSLAKELYNAAVGLSFGHNIPLDEILNELDICYAKYHSNPLDWFRDNSTADTKQSKIVLSLKQN